MFGGGHHIDGSGMFVWSSGCIENLTVLLALFNEYVLGCEKDVGDEAFQPAGAFFIVDVACGSLWVIDLWLPKHQYCRACAHNMCAMNQEGQIEVIVVINWVRRSGGMRCLMREVMSTTLR